MPAQHRNDRRESPVRQQKTVDGKSRRPGVKYNRIKWVMASALLLVSVTYACLESRNDVVKLLTESVSDNERAVSQLLDIAVAYNLSIRNQMESNIGYIRDESGTHPLFTEVTDYPDLNAYGLSVEDPGNGDFLVASLSGIGSLDSLDAETQNEIAASLLLDLTSPLEEEKHEFIWSYYTSDKGFLMIAPGIDINTFHLQPYAYEKPFWQIATPENNPGRHTVISEPYEDAAGRGRMISISTPVYSDSVFRGIASLDVGITYLKNVLHTYSVGLDDNLLLVTADGVIAVDAMPLALGADDIISLDFQAIQPYTLSIHDNHFVFSSHLIRDTFAVVYHLSRLEMHLFILNSASEEILIAALVSIVFWLVLHLMSLLHRTRNLARIDGLSQVFNRQTLEELSVREFLNSRRRRDRISVIMLDIDHFKKFNDTYGHKVGDSGIRHLAGIISESVRKTDIVGRYGGEEFMVTLPDTGIRDAAVVAEKLRLAVEESTFNHGLKMTVSIGCAEYDPSNDIESFEDLCSRADEALYEAKNGGRNRVSFQGVPSDCPCGPPLAG